MNGFHLISRKLKLLVYALVLAAVSLVAYSFKVADNYLNPPIYSCGVIDFCGTMDITPRYRYNSLDHKAMEAPLGFALDPDHGEKLFKANCNSCHVMGRNMIGPNLMGVNERVTFEWMWDFMSRPDSFKATQDPYLIALLEKWEPESGLHPPQQISKQELRDIRAYFEMYH